MISTYMIFWKRQMYGDRKKVSNWGEGGKNRQNKRVLLALFFKWNTCIQMKWNKCNIMLSNILSNIKKARMKKFYINLSISFPIFIFSFSILKDSESNLIIFGVFGIIAALFCVGLALKELVSALNCENSIFFLRFNLSGLIISCFGIVVNRCIFSSHFID